MHIPRKPHLLALHITLFGERGRKGSLAGLRVSSILRLFVLFARGGFSSFIMDLKSLEAEREAQANKGEEMGDRCLPGLIH